MKRTFYILLLLVSIILSSCSKHDYTNAIPSNSTAIIAINAADFTSEKSPFASLLVPFVDNDTKQLKGVDLTRDIFLFSSGDGNLGACAPIADDDNLADFVSRLENIGVLKNAKEQDGKQFYTFKDQWVMGYDDGCLLIMGPVTGADAEARLIRRMTKLMDRDDDESVKNSTIWQHLEEQKNNIRMVAQASALPEQLAVIVALGAPKGTDPDDVLLEAALEYDNGVLALAGKTCSYNQNIAQSMKQSQSVYRPITTDWQQNMTDSIVAGVFMNVKGTDIMPYIQRNKSLNSMLMGSNAYEKIRNNDGNISITMTPKKGGKDNESYDVSVTYPTPSQQKGNEKLVVAVNVNALAGPMAQSIAPFLGKIKTIVYKLKVE